MRKVVSRTQDRRIRPIFKLIAAAQQKVTAMLADANSESLHTIYTELSVVSSVSYTEHIAGGPLTVRKGHSQGGPCRCSSVGPQ